MAVEKELVSLSSLVFCTFRSYPSANVRNVDALATLLWRNADQRRTSRSAVSAREWKLRQSERADDRLTFFRAQTITEHDGAATRLARQQSIQTARRLRRRRRRRLKLEKKLPKCVPAQGSATNRRDSREIDDVLRFCRVLGARSPIPTPSADYLRVRLENLKLSHG